MDKDALEIARLQIGERIAEVRSAMPRLSPLDLYARMDAIRKLAAENGIAALECLARNSAQLALLPGHRMAVRSALEHVDEALDCANDHQTTAMLAALAIRLH